ncbi:MAG: VCBS repeat-containing protein, partial [Thermoplasmata archaeon]|nr:VCBS repeat-containing protein [Thermoplasmata archaeon]
KWDWRFVRDVEAASCGAEIEAGANGLSDDLKVLFHVVSWNGEEDFSDETIGGNRVMDVGGIRTAPIEGNTVSFGTKNDVGSGGNAIWSMASADFDNDGAIDLLTGSGSSSSPYEIVVWQNDGTPFNGTWSSNSVGDISGAGVGALAVGDFDHDGWIDIISGDKNDNIYAWENNGTPFSGDWPDQGGNNNIGNGTGGINDLAVADFDNDGGLDVVSVSSSGSGYEVIAWENPYNSTDTNPFDQNWTQHNIKDLSYGFYAVAVGDIDNDGLIDVVTGDSSKRIRIYENTYNGSAWNWTRHSLSSIDKSIYAVSLADLNNDSYLDIISGGKNGELVVWENDANTSFDWSFTQHNLTDCDANINDLITGDFDNDGDMDIVSVMDDSVTDDEIKGFINDGSPFTGDWSTVEIYDGGSDDYRALCAGDFDNDGDVDLATGREGSGNRVAVWKNTLIHRNMPFDNGTDIGDAYSYVYSVAVGDLDNDGDLDIVSGEGKGNVSVWKNDGSPFNGTWNNYKIGNVGGGSNYIYSVAVGDLDND